MGVAVANVGMTEGEIRTNVSTGTQGGVGMACNVVCVSGSTISKGRAAGGSRIQLEAAAIAACSSHRSVSYAALVIGSSGG